MCVSFKQKELIAQGDTITWTFAKYGSVVAMTQPGYYRHHKTLRCRVVIGDLDVQAGEQTARKVENLGR